MGKRFAAPLYFNVTSSELADRVLVDFLELQKELAISIHIRSMDQHKAIRMMKMKSSDLDAIKIKEQQKAIIDKVEKTLTGVKQARFKVAKTSSLEKFVTEFATEINEGVMSVVGVITT